VIVAALRNDFEHNEDRECAYKNEPSRLRWQSDSLLNLFKDDVEEPYFDLAEEEKKHYSLLNIYQKTRDFMVDDF